MKFNFLILFLNLSILAYTQEIPSSTLNLLLDKNSQIAYDNRVDLAFNNADEPVMIYALKDKGTFIQKMNPDWVPDGSPINLSETYFLDFKVVNDDYYVLGQELAGYSGAGPLDYEDEGNILVFIKIDANGKVVFKKNLFGHEGVKGGSFFLCTYAGNGVLDFDGTYFHAYVETCGNFTAKGSSEFDIHETDYYLTFDQNGEIRPGGKKPWHHSHASLVQMKADGTGEAVSMTVGDGSPWGIAFTRWDDGAKVADRVIFPDQTKLPYKDMYGAAKSSTDAGEIGGIVKIGEYFYTVIATVPVENHPIINQQKDLLFIKLDKNGNEVEKKWIARTSKVDETIPYIMEYKGNIFMVYMKKTGEYDYDYKATVSLLSTSGDYVIEPFQTELLFNWQTRFVKFSNGDIAMLSVEAQGNMLYLTRFGKTKFQDVTGQIAPGNSDNNITVSVEMTEEKEDGKVALDLRKTKENNRSFQGSYSVNGKTDPNNGQYINGEYQPNSPGFYLSIDNLDYSNFFIEAEFMVENYQEAPVFSLSRSYRMLDFMLRDNGKIALEINNREIVHETEKTYSLNTWHRAKIAVNGSKISMYMDGILVIEVNSNIKRDGKFNWADISTTTYGRGLSLKGYIKTFKVG